MSSIFHLRPDWLPSCTPLMILIMMDITMAKRSITYDTNETYDSSKVVEVSRAVRWHERNTLVSTSYGCSIPRGGYHTLFMTCVNDLEQKMACMGDGSYMKISRYRLWELKIRSACAYRRVWPSFWHSTYIDGLYYPQGTLGVLVWD